MLNSLQSLLSNSGPDPIDVDSAEHQAPPSRRSSTRKRRNASDPSDSDASSFEHFFQDLTKDPNSPLEPTVVRNILLVGVTRAGKTTLLKGLQDPKYVDTKMASMVSGTVHARMHNFSAKKPDGSAIAINIVDTPGLFEIGNSDRTARDNTKIASVIMDCLQNELTKIHRVFFCFSRNLGLTSPNVESIRLLLEKFPAFKGKCSLIVTMCEDLDQPDLAALEHQIRENSQIPDISSMPIFFSGSIERKGFLRRERDRVARQYQQVRSFRSKLIQHLLDDCNDPMKIDAVTKFETYHSQAEASIRELRRCIPTLVQRAAQPVKDRQFYEAFREAMTTVARFLNNPLAYSVKDTLQAELQQFYQAISDDTELKKLAESQ
jgi:GTPase SAR1 family protein